MPYVGLPSMFYYAKYDVICKHSFGLQGSCAFWILSSIVFFTKKKQLRAPQFLFKSTLSCRNIDKLRFELQGNCAKRDGFILLRKIRCFSKMTRFGTYFELPVGSSPICKDFVSKRSCFLHFCNFPVESSRANASLGWKLPGSGQSKVATWSKCLIMKSCSPQLKWKIHIF